MIKQQILALTLFAMLLFLDFAIAATKQQASAGEVFTYKIDPSQFNWTNHVISEQFRYRASLKDYPDLPSWMRYMYSHEYHAGFIYGTPPETLTGKTIELDIIALNKEDYVTRHMVLPIFIAQKFPTPNIVQMKIDNLNWVHLMDPGRVENLRNIFHELWPESQNDLSLVFLESAVNMGGRLPLQPQQREGVVVHLGSFARFSPRLKELQDEVSPLYKLQGSCPFKRTSVQKIFEHAGFKLDWCAFKMVGADISPEVLFHNTQNSDAGNLKRIRAQEKINLSMMSREDVPIRNYIDEFALSFAIPGVIFAIFLGLLSVILCFKHKKLDDKMSDYFIENIFHICEESCESSESESSDESSTGVASGHNKTVHMVQYASDDNQPMTSSTLKSLKDRNSFLDNTSLHSHSQSPTFKVDYQTHSYMRPKPPIYKGSATSTLSRNGGGNI